MILKDQKQFIYSKTQTALEQHLQSFPEHELEDALEQRLCQLTQEAYNNTHSNFSMEEVSDYSAKSVAFILADATSIQDWLNKSLEHIRQRVGEYVDRCEDFEQRLRNVKRTKVQGSFNYRSVVRNLAVGQTVNPAILPAELGKFFIKAKDIQEAGASEAFSKLLDAVDAFRATGDDEDKLKAIFKLSEAYHKTILPSKQNKDIYGLQVVEGREIWMDRTVYVGGRVFYAYTPTELTTNSGSLWSGFVRTTKADLDLKAEVPYLSKSECLQLCKVLRHHAKDFSKSNEYQAVAARLLSLIRSLEIRYSQISKQRKISTKPYVLLMNLAVSHLYGIQIKTINQVEGVYKATLRYIETSLKELEKENAA